MCGCLVYAAEGLFIYLLNNVSAETFAFCLAHFFLPEQKKKKKSGCIEPFLQWQICPSLSSTAAIYNISAPCVFRYYDNQQYNIEMNLRPPNLPGKMPCLSINPTSEAERCCGVDLCQIPSVLMVTLLSVLCSLITFLPIPLVLNFNPLLFPSGQSLPWKQPACSLCSSPGFGLHHSFTAWIIELILSAISELLCLSGPTLGTNLPDKCLNFPNCTLSILHGSPPSLVLGRL